MTGNHLRFPSARSFFIALPLFLAACTAVPEEGLIMYHEPVAPTGYARKGKLRPLTQIFTTAERDLAEESSVQTFSGTIEGAGNTRSSTDNMSRRIIKEILLKTGSKPTRILTSERFGELWSRLHQAGLFKLPAQPADPPPRNRPYFLVEAGDSKDIYVRPTLSSLSPDDPGVEWMEYWRGAKLVLVNFLNEP